MLGRKEIQETAKKRRIENVEKCLEDARRINRLLTRDVGQSLL